MNHIKTIMRYTLSLFILTFCTNQSSGNDLEIQKFINSYDKSNAIILDQISISASKVPTELKKTGSSVTIITKDDIENSNEIFLIDYLLDHYFYKFLDYFQIYLIDNQYQQEH